MQSSHPCITTPNATAASSDTATVIVAGKPPTIPAIISTVTIDTRHAKIMVMDTHQHTPTNTEILNNPKIFRWHLVEIDHHLNANDELAEGNSMIMDDIIKVQARHKKPFAFNATTAIATMLTSQEEFKVNNGPHNEPTKTIHTSTAQSHKKRTRIIHDHAANPKTADKAMAGSKRKPDITDCDVDSDKKQKLDTDTRILGKIFVEQPGSMVVAMQHRQVQ